MVMALLRSWKYPYSCYTTVWVKIPWGPPSQPCAAKQGPLAASLQVRPGSGHKRTGMILLARSENP